MRTAFDQQLHLRLKCYLNFYPSPCVYRHVDPYCFLFLSVMCLSIFTTSMGYVTFCVFLFVKTSESALSLFALHHTRNCTMYHDHCVKPAFAF